MKRAIQQTATAAVLATGAELSRRGYDVTFTPANMARINMLCAVSDGKPFKVQVKGISTPKGFYIHSSFLEGIQPDAFLFVVVVPPSQNSATRFFVLSHLDAGEEFKKMPTRKRDGRPYIRGSGLN